MAYHSRRLHPRCVFQVHELPSLWFKLMLHHHLNQRDKLQLFMASKGLAVTVLQEATSIKLHLRMPCAQRRTRSQRPSDSTALLALLAEAPNTPLRLVLDGGIPEAWGLQLQQQVSHLTLRNITMIMTGDMLQNRLQLQHCPQLYSLTLAEEVTACAVNGSITKVMQQRINWAPPALRFLTARACTDDMTCKADCQCARSGNIMLQLLGAQLTQLSLGCNGEQLQLSMLQNLTRVAVACLGDQLLHQLAALPCLTVVKATCLDLGKDHTNRQVKWNQLEITQSASISDLKQLPLQHIQCLILHSQLSFSCWSEPLEKCPALQCCPSWSQVLGMPEFTICAMSPILARDHLPKLVCCIANSLTSACSLHIEHVGSEGSMLRGWQSEAWGVCIEQLPISVDTLHLSFADCITWWRDAKRHRPQYWTQMWQARIAALPQHVKRLVVEHTGVTRFAQTAPREEDMCWEHARAAASALTASMQHTATQLVVVISSVRLTKEDKLRLEGLVQKYPSRVQVVYKPGY